MISVPARLKLYEMHGGVIGENGVGTFSQVQFIQILNITGSPSPNSLVKVFIYIPWIVDISYTLTSPEMS